MVRYDWKMPLATALSNSPVHYFKKISVVVNKERISTLLVCGVEERWVLQGSEECWPTTHHPQPD